MSKPIQEFETGASTRTLTAWVFLPLIWKCGEVTVFGSGGVAALSGGLPAVVRSSGAGGRFAGRLYSKAPSQSGWSSRPEVPTSMQIAETSARTNQGRTVRKRRAHGF